MLQWLIVIACLLIQIEAEGIGLVSLASQYAIWACVVQYNNLKFANRCWLPFQEYTQQQQPH